jgi:hypothetical protein
MRSTLCLGVSSGEHCFDDENNSGHVACIHCGQPQPIHCNCRPHEYDSEEVQMHDPGCPLAKTPDGFPINCPNGWDTLQQIVQLGDDHHLDTPEISLLSQDICVEWSTRRRIITVLIDKAGKVTAAARIGSWTWHQSSLGLPDGLSKAMDLMDYALCAGCEQPVTVQATVNGAFRQFLDLNGASHACQKPK